MEASDGLCWTESEFILCSLWNWDRTQAAPSISWPEINFQYCTAYYVPTTRVQHQTSSYVQNTSNNVLLQFTGEKIVCGTDTVTF